MSLNLVNSKSAGAIKFLVSVAHEHHLVFARSLDEALELTTDYVADHFPGLLANEAIESEYRNLVATNWDESEALDQAHSDTMSFGSYGDSLHSEDVNYVENPDRAYLIALRDRR